MSQEEGGEPQEVPKDAAAPEELGAASTAAAPPETPPQPSNGSGQASNPPSASHPGSAPRYPHPGGRAPEGYYPPVYPPGDASAPPYPPRGYEGAPPPYGMPPHMAGYPPPMYPYQPPMYPPYPGYPPPGAWGYPPPDPSMAHAGYLPPDGANLGPAGYAKKDDDDKLEGDSGVDADEDPNEDIVPGAVTARLKTYIKPRIPTTQDVLDRRARKNAQSRARAAKLRQRVVEIEKKPEDDRTDEEKLIFAQFENRRQRKNDRSRERAMEKKEEIDRILAKQEKKRTKIEKQFLDNALSAKKRKNEGDRLRRQRLKQMGLSTKGGPKSAIHRGGHMGSGRPSYPAYAPYGGGGPHMGEIPLSPMPQMGGHHAHGMQSPGGFGSPGMMPGMGYPSPSRRAAGGPPGVMETPGRSGGNMPYMPPHGSYENQGSPDYQQAPDGSNSRVEQRRNPDGSMSISIGGNSGAAAGNGNGGGEEPSSMNISDVSHLLLYDNPEEGEGQMQDADVSGGDNVENKDSV